MSVGLEGPCGLLRQPCRLVGSRAGGVSDKLSLTLQALVLIRPRGFAWEA